MAAVKLNTCHVAGLEHRLERAQIKKLAVGDKLDMVREPTNAYDKLAIKLISKGVLHVGYIPRSHNEPLAGLMDYEAFQKDRYKLYAVIEDVASDTRHNPIVIIGVFAEKV